MIALRMSTKARVTKKQATRKAKAKAAESGVSAAQAVFAKILKKSDPASRQGMPLVEKD